MLHVTDKTKKQLTNSSHHSVKKDSCLVRDFSECLKCKDIPRY